MRMLIDETNSKINKIKGLDGFRGLACCFVVMSHLGHAGLTGQINMAGIGKYGVGCFFILSAYLMMKITMEKDFNGTDYWISFFKSRFKRIYPLFTLVCLGFYAVGIIIKDFSFTLSDVINNLALIDGYRHLWAIPIEFKFYIIFPFLFFIIRYFCFRVLDVLFLWFLTLALSLFIEYETLNLLKYLNLFVLGVLSYILSVNKEVVGYFVKHKDKESFVMLLVVIGLVLCIPQVFSLFFYKVEYDFLHDYIGVYSLLWVPIIMMIIINKKSRTAIFFSSIFLDYIGKRSYSIYLLHPFVMYYSKSIDSKWLAILVFMVVTLLITEISYRFIEMRFTNKVSV